MANHLKNETSPYLLQHAENPVDWYPWCSEAFERAKAEDKPVFLSIGYSTCHWCHVMAHESFEDEKIARLLNRDFIAIKVDKEERPDLDSIYMQVCQAFTGSGGWPTSIFMTPDQKPFFAGTYFPKTARHGMPGMYELLSAIAERWKDNRASLLQSADAAVSALREEKAPAGTADELLIESAVALYARSFDAEFGGFGRAPKFPAPHNLLFLLAQFQKNGDAECLNMAEKTLMQMYRGGLFDHIGYGFCRYSTDSRFLVPHFEKMLYDNALLILAYCKAYTATQKEFYRSVAQKTAAYILREMTGQDGGFYSAQDADSEGEEGKYYLFEPSELIRLLGRGEGEAFNRYYGITERGNFEGKSIPNLLDHSAQGEDLERLLPSVYEYRRQRYHLHLDDKVLTAWNALMIAAMCRLYRVSGREDYLHAAKKAERCIRKNLCDGETLFVSYRAGRRGQKGFLDDYACYTFALLELYGATLDCAWLEEAQRFCKKAMADFWDEANGGFYLYGREHETLILRPKETYDGAIPSGNSMMAHNLVRLSQITGEETYEQIAQRQLDFLSVEAQRYPVGYSMFLIALSDYFDPSRKITAVIKHSADIQELPLLVSPETAIAILDRPTEEYPLKGGRTTYYVCQNRSCLPPVNQLCERILQ